MASAYRSGYVAEQRDLGGVVLPVRLNPADFPDFPAVLVQRVMRPAQAYAAEEYKRVLREHDVCAEAWSCPARWDCTPHDCLAPAWTTHWWHHLGDQHADT